MVAAINVRLSERYGQTLSGQPHFRVVWSEDQYEVRVGNFNEFYGPIFIRSYRGAKKVQKYNYIKDRWILEMWKLCNPPTEIVDYNFMEPIYVFESAKGDPLPVAWKPIELICWCVLNPMDSIHIKQAIEDRMSKIDKDDVEYFYDMFDITKQQSQFMDRSAIILPGKVISHDEN